MKKFSLMRKIEKNCKVRDIGINYMGANRIEHRIYLLTFLSILFIFLLSNNALAQRCCLSDEFINYGEFETGSLYIDLVKTEGKLLPGMVNAEIHVWIGNRGENTLEDLRVYLSPEFPFTAYKPTVNYLGDVGTFGSVKATFYLNIDPNALEDTYDIPIYAEYKIKKDEISKKEGRVEKHIDRGTIKLKVYGFSFLNLEEARTKPNPVLPEEGFLLFMKLKNEGSKPIYDIKGEVKSEILASTSHFHINALGIGEDKEIILNLTTKDVSPGVNNIQINLYYQDLEYENLSTTRYIPVYVEAKTIDVEILDVNAIGINPGESGSINFVIRNIGEEDLHNFKLVANLYSPIASVYGNEMFLGNLKRGSVKNFSFPISVDRKAESKLYTIPFTFKYRDSLDKEHSKNISIGIQVRGIPEIAIGTTDTDPTRIIAKSPFTLSVELENVGTGEARSVHVALKADEFLGEKESYIGSLDPDDTGTAIFDLVAPKEGDKLYPVTITAEYSDNYGNTYRKIFELNISTYKKPISKTPFIVGGLLIVGILYYAWRRKKHAIE